jgi:hypothetical protein
MTQPITVNDLIEALANTPTTGAKQATLLTRTFPKLLKRDRQTGRANPFADGTIARLAQRPVTLGACYEAAVNRQRTIEQGQEVEYFNALDLWNGYGVYHSPYTVQHKTTGRLYFAVKPAQQETDTEIGRKAVVHNDVWLNVQTLESIDPERLENLLPQPHKAKRQDVDHDILWRTIALDNVVEVHYAGHYRIVH